MDSNYFATSMADPFDGVIPASFAGHAPMSPVALPRKPKIGNQTVVMIVLGILSIVAIGVAMWFYFRPMNDMSGASTPFTASIEAITDPNQRAEAQALDRALASASTEPARAALRQALSVTLGGQPMPHREPMAPMAPSAAVATQQQQQQPTPSQPQQPRAEPPLVHRAPDGDPNFLRIP